MIAGAGHAAGQVIATLKQKKFDGHIYLIGEEAYLPYQRPALSKKYLAGELSTERLHFKANYFYNEPNFEVHLNTKIDKFEPTKKVIQSNDNLEFPYDTLVLSLGAHARHMDLPGVELAGVHYLRTIKDADKIREKFRPGRRLIIVGAGYIGLEVAAIAVQLGLEVSVVEVA